MSRRWTRRCGSVCCEDGGWGVFMGKAGVRMLVKYRLEVWLGSSPSGRGWRVLTPGEGVGVRKI